MDFMTYVSTQVSFTAVVWFRHATHERTLCDETKQNAAKETRHKWNWQSWYSDTLFMSLLQNPRGLGDFRL